MLTRSGSDFAFEFDLDFDLDGVRGEPIDTKNAKGAEGTKTLPGMIR